MQYSKKEIGRLLVEELNKGYSIDRLVNWSDKLFVNERNQYSYELENVLCSISIMGVSKKFEYTEEELRLLAELLLNEEKDPIEFINNLRSEDVIKDTIILEISKNELKILSNALSEVCNLIEEWEFDTRMGIKIENARIMLESVTSIYNRSFSKME
jgi:hypothetical protein